MSLVPAPLNTGSFAFQILQNSDTYRFLPIFAFPQNNIISIRVDGGDVNLILTIPPATYFSKMERPVLGFFTGKEKEKNGIAMSEDET